MKSIKVLIMLVIMIGGSFIKSCITGTVARETTRKTRAQGYSIFYMMVNIGAFSGKTIVKPLRDALGNLLGGESILGFHPVALMMIVGIVFQGLAETFISPRYLEFFSLLAPKGEEGLYLGFSQLHSFLSSILGFGLSGYLLIKYCPDPLLFDSHEQWQAVAVNAQYLVLLCGYCNCFCSGTNNIRTSC